MITWRQIGFFVSAFVAGVSLAGFFLAVIFERDEIGFHAWFVSVGAFAVMSGTAWHLNMRGRAKNGLLFVLFALAFIMFLNA